MTNRLDGRVAVITGGGNGIGRACALKFAAEGAAVALGDIQADAAEAVATEVEAMGGRAVGLRVEASTRADNEALVAAALDLGGGRIDALVTAAGISHANYWSGDVEADVKVLAGALDYLERPGWDFVDTDIDQVRRVIDVNLIGTMHAMQAVAPVMLHAGAGSIITIASVAAKHPDAGPLGYTVSKAAVWMLTKKAARMLGPAGVRVNAIGPGFIDTSMTKITDFFPDEQRAQFMEAIPLRRKGEAAEVADCAVFLAGDESSYFTGAILHPDGGFFTD